MQIDYESLQDVIDEITAAVDEDKGLRPMNPVLVHDPETGEFAIESEITTEKDIWCSLGNHMGLMGAYAVLGGAKATELDENWLLNYVKEN